MQHLLSCKLRFVPVLLSMENKWLDNIERKLAEPARATVDAEEISEELDVRGICRLLVLCVCEKKE